MLVFINVHIGYTRLASYVRKFFDSASQWTALRIRRSVSWRRGFPERILGSMPSGASTFVVILLKVEALDSESVSIPV